jgi:replication factor C large subunit
VIILDEVDNIHKKEDSGGEIALLRIIKKRPPQPLILIANDLYALSRDLRNACEIVNYRRLDYRSIVKVLLRICKEEGIRADKSVLTIIAKNSGGDLRGAINDLQAIAEGKDSISEEDVAVSTRTQETDIFKILQKIFKSDDPEVYNLSMLLNESPEDIIWWVSENLPLEYSGEDLLRSTLILSRADMFLGRVRRRQYYRLWKYSGYLMTTGIQQAKREKKAGFTRYKRPMIWQKLLQTRKKREKVRKILSKIGKNSHLSSKKAYNEMFFLIKLLLSVLDVERASKICAFYEFDEEDVEFLTGDEERALAISKYIEEHNLIKVDESFLSGFEDAVEDGTGLGFGSSEDVKRESETEKGDEDKEDVKRIKSKGKRRDLTLDHFFG